MSDLAELEEYIYDAYRAISTATDTDTKIYRSTMHIFPTPIQLHPNNTNRILIFPGSFNPPHKGHLEYLGFCFKHAKEDLNLVAAITIPADDDNLEDKKGPEKAEILLSKAQRVKLWKEHVGALPWNWIYDLPRATFEKFQMGLQTAVQKDGGKIEFVHLLHPEDVKPEPKLTSEWGTRILLASNCGRVPPVVNKGSLAPMKGFDSGWTEVSSNHYVHNWECHNDENELYFIHSQAGKDVAVGNSADIRAAIEGSKDERVLLALVEEGLALSPKKLVEFSMEYHKSKAALDGQGKSEAERDSVIECT